jgi:hypothetical protein
MHSNNTFWSLNQQLVKVIAVLMLLVAGIVLLIALPANFVWAMLDRISIAPRSYDAVGSCPWIPTDGGGAGLFVKKNLLKWTACTVQNSMGKRKSGFGTENED